MSTLRYLICRPRGGLNDTLCQIEKCWQYAEQFNRVLIIDTYESGLMANFFDFFVVKKSSVAVRGNFTDEELKKVNQLSCLPEFFQGELFKRSIYFLNPQKNYVDYLTQQSATFDFNVDHTQEILVHEQSGGGTLSFECLGRLSFSKKISESIQQALAKLPKNYQAIHVRNTDYQTDYNYYFKKIKKRVSKNNLLVCSDDNKSIDQAKNTFLLTNVFSITTLVKTSKNQPLHLRQYYTNQSECETATKNALIDLIGLGLADILFIMSGNHGHPSGFSVLAAYLCEHKKIIRQLLDNHSLLENKTLAGRVVFLLSAERQINRFVPKLLRGILRPLLKRNSSHH